MIERFVDNDHAYVAWLAAHPSGYVLNTFPHVTASYLVLHRARCRTVNRPLSDDRRWTHQYGKTCSDDHAELAEWARRETGKSVHPCGSCLQAETQAAGKPAPAGPSIARPHGPRAPRPDDREIRHEGTPVRIVIEQAGRGDGHAGPPLVIEGAQWLAEVFFRSDPSAVGAMSYDTCASRRAWRRSAAGRT
jgi:hypothetical protein